MKSYLLCCDWGTSSFRLRLVNIDNQEIVAEIFSSEGIASTFDAWKNTENGQTPKPDYFIDQLKRQVELLEVKAQISVTGIAIVISGMASSSIGMVEIPYTDLPVNLDWPEPNTHYINASDHFPHDIVLISGVMSKYDVMRGEETQLFGLSNLLNFTDKESILIFPGTHSKHMHVIQNQLVDFQTYMTGEIYNLLSSHSILKNSVEIGIGWDLSPDTIDAFQLGVKDADNEGVLKALFRVRTNQLFNKLKKKENTFYLSGLLIGSEVKHLSSENNVQFILCSGSNLSELYKLAFDELKLLDRMITVSSDDVDRATVAGQIKIFQRQNQDSL